MISPSEVKQIIAEYDAKQQRSSLDYYVAFMKIVLKNEGVSLDEWDDLYRDSDRQLAFEKANCAIAAVLQPETPESPGYKDEI